jgi:hypothetical protein
VHLEMVDMKVKKNLQLFLVRHELNVYTVAETEQDAIRVVLDELEDVIPDTLDWNDFRFNCKAELVNRDRFVELGSPDGNAFYDEKIFGDRLSIPLSKAVDGILLDTTDLDKRIEDVERALKALYNLRSQAKCLDT